MTDESENTETEVEQLNSIARHRALSSNSNVEASDQSVQNLGQSIHNSLTDRLDELVTETTLSRSEAEAWELTEYRDEHGTNLTEDAITLLFNTPKTGFGDTEDAHSSLNRSLFEFTDPLDHRENVEQKMSEAEETMIIAQSEK